MGEQPGDTFARLLSCRCRICATWRRIGEAIAEGHSSGRGQETALVILRHAHNELLDVNCQATSGSGPLLAGREFRLPDPLGPPPVPSPLPLAPGGGDRVKQEPQEHLPEKREISNPKEARKTDDTKEKASSSRRSSKKHHRSRSSRKVRKVREKEKKSRPRTEEKISPSPSKKAKDLSPRSGSPSKSVKQPSEEEEHEEGDRTSSPALVLPRIATPPRDRDPPRQSERDPLRESPKRPPGEFKLTPRSPTSTAEKTFLFSQAARTKASSSSSTSTT